MIYKDKAFSTLLYDDPREYKYNPYPIYYKDILFLEFIKEIERPQVIGFFKLIEPKIG